MLKKFYNPAAMETLSDRRQVKVICSSDSVDRDGEIVVQTGIDASAYRRNPTVLFNHDPNRPIARCVDVGVMDGKMQATIQFPPAGEITRSDECYAMIKNGLLNGISLGFLPKASIPLDPGNTKRGPQKYTACELMEISFTPVPANADAVVTGKAAKHRDNDAERLHRLHQVEVLRLTHPPENRTAKQIQRDEIAELAHIGARQKADAAAMERAEVIAQRNRHRATLRAMGRLV